MFVEKEKIFFIDEYGRQIYTRRGYEYSEVGKRTPEVLSQIRSQYSVCAAMNCDVLYYFETQDRAYNGENFII